MIRRIKRMNKYFYIYNPHQADFFLKMGVPILKIGIGKKGEVFIKFPRNEESETVFTEWVERKKNP
jgi:hypothetical protein